MEHIDRGGGHATPLTGHSIPVKVLNITHRNDIKSHGARCNYQNISLEDYMNERVIKMIHQIQRVRRWGHESI